MAEFYKWLITFVCGGIVAGIIARYKQRRKRDKALAEGVQALLRAEIIRQHEKHTERGYCPVYAKEALKRAYHAYHNLEGNDVATELYHETLELPNEPTHRERKDDKINERIDGK